MADTSKQDVHPVDGEHDLRISALQGEIAGPASISFFRGTLFQALVVGLASFLAPGMYAALSATGAGGLANVSPHRQQSTHA